jgi:C4-dicarboxylate transporter DctM subunit
MTPLLLPVAHTYGVTTVHFGTILIVNMCVGFLTPPFAVGVFVGSKIAGASFGETIRESVPFMLVGLVAIFVTTLFPGYVDFFVKLFS